MRIALDRYLGALWLCTKVIPASARSFNPKRDPSGCWVMLTLNELILRSYLVGAAPLLSGRTTSVLLCSWGARGFTGANLNPLPGLLPGASPRELSAAVAIFVAHSLPSSLSFPSCSSAWSFERTLRWTISQLNVFVDFDVKNAPFVFVLGICKLLCFFSGLVVGFFCSC